MRPKVEHQRVAAALVSTSGQLWATFLGHVQKLIGTRLWEPLIIAKRRKYDETPLKVRTREEAATSGDPAAKTGLAAKIMQTHLSLFVLLRRVADGTFLHVQGDVPGTLQVVDSCTAKTVAATQRVVEQTIPNLQSVSAAFPLRVNMPCSDKHPSNAACEGILNSEFKGWVTAHTFCQIHRVSTTTKATCALVEGHTSGIIAIAQALQFAGSTRQLRRILREVLADRLEVRLGDPPGEDYRSAVLDVVLSSTSTARSGHRAARHLRRTAALHIKRSNSNQQK